MSFVFVGSVEGVGETKLMFPLGPVIKCLLFNEGGTLKQSYD